MPPQAYAQMQVLQQAVEATKGFDDGKLADYIRTSTFKTVEIVTSGGGELAIDHTSGNAAVVPCP